MTCFYNDKLGKEKRKVKGIMCMLICEVHYLFESLHKKKNIGNLNSQKQIQSFAFLCICFKSSFTADIYIFMSCFFLLLLYYFSMVLKIRSTNIDDKTCKVCYI